jgi:hypothetical protein
LQSLLHQKGVVNHVRVLAQLAEFVGGRESDGQQGDQGQNKTQRNFFSDGEIHRERDVNRRHESRDFPP